MKRSKRRHNAVGVLLLLFLSTPGPVVGSSGAPPINLPPQERIFSYEHVALVRVVDADTVRLTIDLGFGLVLVNQSFRLIGIDAPELNTEEGRRAKAALEEFLKGKRLRVDVAGRDSFGRWLCVLWAGALDTNDWLVDEGWAVEYGR